MAANGAYQNTRRVRLSDMLAVGLLIAYSSVTPRRAVTSGETIFGVAGREAGQLGGDLVVRALYFYRIRERSCVTWLNKRAICRDCARSAACWKMSILCQITCTGAAGAPGPTMDVFIGESLRTTK